MEQLISKMCDFPRSNIQIKTWCDQNSIQHPKIMNYPLEKISKLYDNFLSKYGLKEKQTSSHKKLIQPIWFQNQLILFQWAVVILGITKLISLKEFTQNQFQFLSQIFRQKQLYVIDYQIKCMIVKGKQIRNSWNPIQQDLLASIIKEIPQKNKWNEIARQLYKRSDGKYFRQGKHCRQRWFSYLQNQNLQKKWNTEDDIQLLQLVSARGKKWNQIVNKFTNVQNKTYLKKRLKQLLQQAKVKPLPPKSQRQTIELLLQQKHQQLQKCKNKDFKTTNQRKTYFNSKKNKQNLIEQPQEHKSSIINDENEHIFKMMLNNSHNSSEIMYDKNMIFGQEQKDLQKQAENIAPPNLLFFDNFTPYYTPYLNIGYCPIQYMPESNLQISQFGVQSVNMSNINALAEGMNNYFCYF